MPFTVTTVSSANAGATAEFVLSMLLIFARNLDEMIRLQSRHEWASGSALNELRGVALEGQSLGIIGLGAIGRRVAQLGRAFRMRVLGMRNSSQPGASDPDCDVMFAPGQLHDLLRESDFVLLSVPLTQQTRRLIGERELQAMRANACLINIARGEVIDESALIRALRERWIAGAALDVVAEEPLSNKSPLWSLPRLILTPHLSGLTTGYAHRVAIHFAENIRRFRASRTLLR
jgi:phosphoglycerate dehydrogenase-like enzyme